MSIPYGQDYPEPEWPDEDGYLRADPVSPALVHHGQARMAYRLAQRYEGELLHVHSIGWHYWDGTRWARDDRGEAKRAVLAELRLALADSLDNKEFRQDVRKCESASGINGVLDIAAALEPFAATVRDLDADPYLLNCANGTLDLRTLELRPHSPADRITKRARGAYDPDAKSPVFGAFLDRVLPDCDVRGYLQRLAGVGLFGNVREHILTIWTGVGSNGKSKMDLAIRNALGDYAIEAEPDLFMCREGAHPTGEMDLLGMRWVSVSENDRGRRMAEATMKRLTGGDTIRARRMRQDFVQFEPSHTAILITNHLPKVSGDDPAIWRRIRVVPFDVVIPEEERDGELGDKLALEADGILGWAVEGWREYSQIGLAEPQAVRVATDTYHRDSDAVARFIAEECLTGSPVLKATTKKLFDGFERWRIRDGGDPMSQKAFGLALDDHEFPARKEDRDKHGRWRSGICLRPESEDES